MLEITIQHFRRWKTRRIKGPLPVFVMPTRGIYADFRSHEDSQAPLFPAAQPPEEQTGGHSRDRDPEQDAVNLLGDARPPLSQEITQGDESNDPHKGPAICEQCENVRLEL